MLAYTDHTADPECRERRCTVQWPGCTTCTACHSHMLKHKTMHHVVIKHSTTLQAYRLKDGFFGKLFCNIAKRYKLQVSASQHEIWNFDGQENMTRFISSAARDKLCAQLITQFVSMCPRYQRWMPGRHFFGARDWRFWFSCKFTGCRELTKTRLGCMAWSPNFTTSIYCGFVEQQLVQQAVRHLDTLGRWGFDVDFRFFCTTECCATKSMESWSSGETSETVM